MPERRSSIDDIIELYMKDVDVSLLRENLKLTPDQRLQNMVNYANFVLQAQEAGRKLRQKKAALSGDSDRSDETL